MKNKHTDKITASDTHLVIFVMASRLDEITRTSCRTSAAYHLVISIGAIYFCQSTPLRFILEYISSLEKTQFYLHIALT
jgi:hypothetical protein